MHFTKLPWEIRSRRSLQNNDVSDSLEKIVFLYVFGSFCYTFSLFMPKSESLPSIFTRSLFFKELLERLAPVALCKRVTVSNWLRSLMTKAWRERFTQVAHDKRATGAICSFSRANRWQKRVKRLKTRWAKSQLKQPQKVTSPLRLFCHSPSPHSWSGSGLRQFRVPEWPLRSWEVKVCLQIIIRTCDTWRYIRIFYWSLLNINYCRVKHNLYCE